MGSTGLVQGASQFLFGERLPAATRENCLPVRAKDPEICAQLLQYLRRKRS